MSKKDKQMQPPGPVWTLEAWIQHSQDLRADDQRALEIKQKADEEALNLARQQQTYKDAKANELREQISSERGNYVSRAEYNVQEQSTSEKIQALSDKHDQDIKPLNDFMISQLGQSSSKLTSRGLLFSILGVIASYGTLIVLFATGAIK
jgi:hypothetical protein